MYKQRVTSNVSDFKTEECFKIHRLIIKTLNKPNPKNELRELYGIHKQSLTKVKSELRLYYNSTIMKLLKDLFKVQSF